MGTRNLTCVVVDGEFKVRQYGQFDGYPQGQGITVLEFLRDKLNKSIFLEKLKLAKPISTNTLRALWISSGADEWGDGWAVTDNVYEEFRKKWPQLHRETAAGVLQFIQDTTKPFLLNLENNLCGEHVGNNDFKNIDWAWCYIVNFDKNVLEVYSRWIDPPITFSLAELPTNEEFLIKFKDYEYNGSISHPDDET